MEDLKSCGIDILASYRAALCSIQLMELKFTEAARALPKDILEHFLLGWRT